MLFRDEAINLSSSFIDHNKEETNFELEFNISLICNKKINLTQLREHIIKIISKEQIFHDKKQNPINLDNESTVLLSDLDQKKQSNINISNKKKRFEIDIDPDNKESKFKIKF